MARISELTTDAGLDALCEMAPYLCAILEDDKLTAELRRKTRLDASSSTAEVYAEGLEKLGKIVPIVLKTHRSDVYAILAAVNGKTVDEIAAQSVFKTAAEIRDIIADKEFKSFFASLRNTGAK